MFPINTNININNININTATTTNSNNNNGGGGNGALPGSWRDSHSGKSSPDLLRHSSSYSSQNAFDTPVSEPTTPDGHHHHLILPKLRTQSTRVSVKPHIRSRPREERLSTSIDLSRSSLELEGLGIYTNLERDSRFSQARNSVASYHHQYPRSITEIASNTNRIGQTYVHPRRQVPTSLTPSLSESQRGSLDEGYFSHANGSLSAFDTVQTPVLDEDSRSLRELKTARTFSEDASRASRPTTIQRANTDATRSLRTGSWKRLSRRQPLADSTARAAAIQAARIAFEEKEASKGRKAEVLRKKSRPESYRSSCQSPNVSPKQTATEDPPSQTERERRRASAAANLTSLFIKKDEEVTGIDFSTREQQRPQTDGADGDDATRVRSQSPVGNANNWVRFMTWSRTRYYKAKRRVSSSHFAIK